MDARPHPALPGSRPRAAAPRPLRLLVLPVVALLLALAGCSADPTASDEAVAPAADASGAAGAAAPEEAGGDAALGSGEVPADGSGAGGSDADGSDADGDDVGTVLGEGTVPGGAGRRVVTAGIDVAVPDVPAAAADVRSLAVAAGGDVHGERSVGGERPRAEIVVRVPVDVTGDLLGDLARLGTEVSRTSETEPVETRLVDLESRTATQRAGVERIRALLQQATSLEDVLALEAELTRRQADLESVDAQRAALDDRAALATVTVVLTLPSDVEPEAAEPLPPFLEGLGAGWDALVGSTTVVLVVLGALLPFLAVAGVVVAVVLAVLRARRRSRGARGSAVTTE